jgi:OHCU decarboxylase
MTMEQVDAMDQGTFVASFADIYEHSAWVAERAFKGRCPFQTLDSLCARMQGRVEAASREEQLALIRAHPDLGTRARVTESSANEQSSAGLDQLTPEEYNRLLHLNTAYKEKFAFPFIFAVKGSGMQAILAALESRLQSTPEEEFAEALRQIYRIARFRLELKIG